MKGETLNIGIDGRELVGQPAGKGLYVQRIIAAWLVAVPFQVHLHIYLHTGSVVPEFLSTWQDQQAGKSELLHITVHFCSGPLWHRTVSKNLKKDGVDVYFAPLSYQSAIWNTIPTVTTVHDLAIFVVKNLVHNKRAQITEKLLLRRSVKKSVHLLAVSQSTKNDLLALTPVQTEKITVTLLAPFFSHQTTIPLSLRKKYILFVGTLEPRKNITTLLRAYAALPKALRMSYHLLIVGKQGWGSEDYLGLAKELHIDSEVEWKGYVSTEDLALLYQHARLFVYPSLYEGFGLPVVEAMAAGTPVVTSAVSSLPEVVGESGSLCDPHNFKEIATEIEKYLTDDAYWEVHQQAVLAQVQNFSWQQTATETLVVLKDSARPVVIGKSSKE